MLYSIFGSDATVSVQSKLEVGMTGVDVLQDFVRVVLSRCSPEYKGVEFGHFLEEVVNPRAQHQFDLNC